MRSLSPSRTFTCTRTVSPDFIGGRSVNCDFSTSSIAPMSQLLQQFFLFIIENSVAQQIRASFERSNQRRPLPPPPNLGVVARQQYIRHAEAADLRRPRELRKVEQPAAERLLRDRLLVADHAANEPGDRVEDHHRRQLAARQ